MTGNSLKPAAESVGRDGQRYIVNAFKRANNGLAAAWIMTSACTVFLKFHKIP